MLSRICRSLEYNAFIVTFSLHELFKYSPILQVGDLKIIQIFNSLHLFERVEHIYW